MNWKQIKKKYPKAWDLLRKSHSTIEVWGHIDHPDVWDMDGLDMAPYELRHLYDFFDEQGIYLYVFITENPDNGNRYWDWQVFIDGECFGSSEVEEPTRKEAETAMYNEAFKILEKQ